MPDDDCKIDIRHFLFWIEPRIAQIEERSPRRAGDRAFAIANVPILEKYEVVVEAKEDLW